MFLFNIKLPMIMSKKYILILLLLISCSVGAIAQTTYYYYKGNKIPLTIDNNKVCLSIPKNKRDISKELLKDVQVLDTIRDTVFDISIIHQSDLKRLTASKSWGKEARNVLLSPSYRTNEGREVYLTPYLYVKLKREQDIDILASCAKDYNLRIVKRNSFLPLWHILSISLESSQNALDIANELWESGNYAAAAPDLSSENIAFCTNDPLFSQQWGLYNNIHSGIDISACNAWNISTGKNVKIAIVDSGIFNNHDDLRDNILNELSYNSETNTSPYNGFWGPHGTHCAGIAAAIKDNNRDIAGVAPDAKLISIYNSSIGGARSTTLEDQLASGIGWAYTVGADVISCSWGNVSQNSFLEDAIHNAFTLGRNGKGCVVVFATGKYGNNYISYPANCNDTILAVGAIDTTGTRPSYSDYGDGLDLVAPGATIMSTTPDNRTDTLSGTSMACPHVAGVAALILQRNPELTVTQVNSIICRNAKKLSGVSFNETKPDGTWNNEYGYGLVDAYNSLLDTPEIVYIQNDTITGTQTIPASSSIPAEKIYIGKDVTDIEEHGNVILGQGDITLRAKSVTIKNSTTVPLGTKLKIVNQ